METISIALICTVGGFILSYAAFMRNKDNAIRAETKEDAETKAKLDYISKGVDDIRIDNKARDRQIQDLSRDVIEVKQSVKSAHHRIDSIENK
jgi:flagellar motor component MotA